jgi:hypothetical protein
VGGITLIGGGLGRLHSDLQLETTFASGGALSSDQFVSGLLIQKDGKIVARRRDRWESSAHYSYI